MDYNSKKDYEKLGELAEGMKSLVESAEGREMTTEEDSRLDDLLKQHTDLEKSIQKKESVAQKLASQDEKIEQIAERTQKSVDQVNEEKEDFRSVLNKYLKFGERNMNAKELEVLSRAQSSGTDSEGGYTVDEVIFDEITKTMAEYGGMRSVCRVLTTATGGPLNFVTNNDTANVGEWLAENSASSAQDTVFGNVQLNAWKASSDYMLVSRELLQDSKFDMVQYISGLIAERIGRLTNTAYTVGDGSSKPNGIADASGFGATNDVAGTVDFDDLLDLKHSVDRAYRNGAVWMLNDATLLALKKTAIASANQSLWQPGIVGGEPATIDGDRYVVNNDLPDVDSASAHSVLYGDFSKYIIRDVTGIEVLRNDYINMGSNQVTFYGFMRTDGDLIDTNAVKHLRCLTT
jgi:HK97 family phage major capsid protein